MFWLIWWGVFVCFVFYEVPQTQRVAAVFLFRKAFCSQPLPNLMDVQFIILETV